MYIKRHKVKRGGREYVYLRLVEAYRTGEGKVRHRVVVTLGREDELKASGQLDQLAGSFARLDPPPVGTRREVGPLLLGASYLERLGIRDVVDQAAPMRGRALLTTGRSSRRLSSTGCALPHRCMTWPGGRPRPPWPSCSTLRRGC